MKKSDIIELEIVDMGIGGEGVARYDNMVIFVPSTATGDLVKVEVVDVKKHFAFAKVIKLIKASPMRVNPPCSVFKKCGGCSLQHINYDAQKALKRQEIVNCFKKYAGIEVTPGEVVTGKKLFGYRNKIAVPFGNSPDGIVYGFYQEKTHKIVPVKRCLLQEDWAYKALCLVTDWAKENRISVYDDVTKKGFLRHCVLRKIGTGISFSIIGNEALLPQAQKLVDKIKTAFDDFTLHFSKNISTSNVIWGDEVDLIYGTNKIECQICGLKAKISPLSFMQVNNEIRDIIYNDVLKHISSDDTVVDIYSGVGIMTGMLAQKAKIAYGIEIVNSAVEDANALAKVNNLNDKMVNIYGDVAKELPTLLEKLRKTESNDGNNKLNSFENKIIVVMDPPRKGADSTTINAILKAEPDKILYISCSPQTLARDIKLFLGSNNYEISEITPYDMFPNASHIECLICLSLKAKN